MENAIGLDQSKSQRLAENLNKLLANYQILYMNVRGFHWNIRGKQFFELHAKFEEIYNNLLLKIDDIAERVLTLGEAQVHAYSVYLGQTEIKEAINVTDGESCVRGVLEGFSVLIRLQREILLQASEGEDEGTITLMSDYISEQEKQVWMLSAYLG